MSQVGVRTSGYLPVHDHSSIIQGGWINWAGLGNSVMKAHCRVYRNASQNIPAATETTIEFNAESYDPSDIFDIANYRANYTSGGKIWVATKICVGSSANNRQITLSIKNASGLISNGFMPVCSGVGISTVEFSDLIDISGTGYLYITILCSEALVIQPGDDRSFAIFRRWSDR